MVARLSRQPFDVQALTLCLPPTCPQAHLLLLALTLCLPPSCPPSSSQAHLLLLAFLERDESAVPANVQADLKFVLQKSPLLLEEMLKIAAALPRAPHGYGWLVRGGGSGW